MSSAQLIRKRRQALKLSLRRLAERMNETLPGIDRQFVWKSEKGLREILAYEIPHFARALECEPGDLHVKLPDRPLKAQTEPKTN